jgi:UDP-N-acetylglucosamine 4,6-dehydratase
MSVLEGSSILVTGGTGSFGKAFLRYVLDNENPKRVVVFSRDELKQHEVRRMFDDDPRLRWFIGDIRDRQRLERAMHGVDYVVHAAALKQVDTAEYNPFEYVQTNVNGSQNVVEAAIDQGVKKVVALSTDKASSPINLYGATKLCSDRMFVSANHYAAHHVTRFSVVRYGNVMGSRGSVIPVFRDLAAQGKSLPITDKRMTRFWITLPQAVQFVVDSFDLMAGGELYIPRIPSMKVVDLAEAVAPGSPTHEIGIRPGEKLHEVMLTEDEARHAFDLGDRFVILPQLASWARTDPDGERLPDGFRYSSDNNDRWLTLDELSAMAEPLAPARRASDRAQAAGWEA